MSQVNLGQLERVDLRSAWLSESGDFTPWLATEDNMAILGDAIGLELEVEGQEKDVGPFRADILCRDVGTDQWVLIENQLERTDHKHLGQLMTYAAGLDAVTVIWIADRFTDEHRAAMDWLNEITDERFSFFGLEIELWRIGDSPPAPKFNIVSKPNAWSKSGGKAKREFESKSSPGKEQKLEFWGSLQKQVELSGFPLKPRKIYSSGITYGIGLAGCFLRTGLRLKQNKMRVRLILSGSKADARYQQLKAHSGELISAVGSELEWEDTADKTRSISIVRTVNSIDKRNEWDELHQWLIDNLKCFNEVFSDRLKSLDLDSGDDQNENE